MKILAGLYPPSGNQLLLGEEPVTSAARARREARHRDGLPGPRARGATCASTNIFLGQELTRRVGPGRLVDHKANQGRAKEHLDKLRIHVKSVSQRVEKLSNGQRQAVAIARAAAFDAKVMIMDEPTAALAVKEVAKVLD
ncbi:MAG: ATP-binding cassette domain-containing protein [Chloroflexota bacterium]